MHLRILPYHQKFFQKRNLYLLTWLKTCFDAHTSITLETFFRKRYFLPSGVVRNVFCAYLRPPETFFQKRYFLPAGVVKNVFWCICAYFHTTRNFFKRDTFYRLEWLKTCQDHQKLFLKKSYFWTSGVIKTVFWCICAYFQTTINFLSKNNFLPSGVVKNVFWCICAYFHTTRNFFSKKIFFTVWSD